VDVDRLAALLRADRVQGWATVDLDRAEEEQILARGWPPTQPAADDQPLGAYTRIARSLDRRDRIVLLEPSTEGLLAASLARHGEGFLVEYLVIDGSLDEAVELARQEGLTLSSASSGPFGPERLVVGGPRWGPHLILAARDPVPAAASQAVTIES
jgi:hypothetical protein